MNVVSMFNDFTLPSGPAKYEELCALHRLVASAIADDLNSVIDGTYEGDEEDKARLYRIIVKFLNDNKIKTDKNRTPQSYVSQLESFELPDRSELKA